MQVRSEFGPGSWDAFTTRVEGAVPPRASTTTPQDKVYTMPPEEDTTPYAQYPLALHYPAPGASCGGSISSSDTPCQQTTTAIRNHAASISIGGHVAALATEPVQRNMARSHASLEEPLSQHFRDAWEMFKVASGELRDQWTDAEHSEVREKTLREVKEEVVGGVGAVKECVLGVGQYLQGFGKQVIPNPSSWFGMSPTGGK